MRRGGWRWFDLLMIAFATMNIFICILGGLAPWFIVFWALLAVAWGILLVAEYRYRRQQEAHAAEWRSHLQDMHDLYRNDGGAGRG